MITLFEGAVGCCRWYKQPFPGALPCNKIKCRGDEF